MTLPTFEQRRRHADDRHHARRGCRCVVFSARHTLSHQVVLRSWQGQPILGKEDLGPVHHMGKQGTPTMGGLAIVASALLGGLLPTRET